MVRFFKKNISSHLLGSLVALIALGAFLFFTFFAQAGTSENMYGYAWSSNIGWISLNDCTDPTDSTTCSSPSYGVNYDFNSGHMSGYGWNDNIGWIDFDPSGTPPYGNIDDWARAVIGGGTGSFGWSGWIDLSLVTADQNTGLVSGYGWEGADLNNDNAAEIGIGWVDFTKANVVTPNQSCITDSSFLSIAADPSFAPDYDTTLRWGTPNNTSYNLCIATGAWSSYGAIPAPVGISAQSQSGVGVDPNGSSFGVQCTTGSQTYCADISIVPQAQGQLSVNVSGPACIPPDFTIEPKISWAVASGTSNTSCESTSSVSGTDFDGLVSQYGGQQNVDLSLVDPSTQSITFEVECKEGGTSSTNQHQMDVVPGCIYAPFISPDFKEI